MEDRIKIGSDALVLLGAEPVNSFEGDSVEALALRAVYDNTYENLLSHRNWSFAKKVVKLQRLDKESEYDYDYVYRLPTEVLRLINLNERATHYRLVGRRELHSNELNDRATVVVKPDETELQGDFVLAFKFLLAGNMAPIVTDNQSQMDKFIQLGTRYIQQAADNDMVQSPMTYIDQSELIDAHFTEGTASFSSRQRSFGR